MTRRCPGSPYPRFQGTIHLPCHPSENPTSNSPKRCQFTHSFWRRPKKKDPDYAEYLEEIGPNDVLLVPDLFWRITHRFSELEGRAFLNPKLKGQSLDIAQQDILFRLDRSGAELRSESKMYCAPIPTYFVVDRPFLIFMRKRDATEPYFAMWVDNAELLTPWEK